MTTAGWIIMLLSVGGVTALFVWTLVHVLRPEASKGSSASDIPTPRN